MAAVANGRNTGVDGQSKPAMATKQLHD